MQTVGGDFDALAGVAMAAANAARASTLLILRHCRSVARIRLGAEREKLGGYEFRVVHLPSVDGQALAGSLQRRNLVLMAADMSEKRLNDARGALSRGKPRRALDHAYAVWNRGDAEYLAPLLAFLDELKPAIPKSDTRAFVQLYERVTAASGFTRSAAVDESTRRATAPPSASTHYDSYTSNGWATLFNVLGALVSVGAGIYLLTSHSVEQSPIGQSWFEILAHGIGAYFVARGLWMIGQTIQGGGELRALDRINGAFGSQRMREDSSDS